MIKYNGRGGLTMGKFKEKARVYAFIAAGAFFLAAGMNMFLLPCKISSGGVGTIGTVFYYIFNIPLSVTNLVFNAILFLAGYRLLGKESLFRSAAGIIFLSVFLELTDFFRTFGEDMFISTIIGGVLIGIGVGLVVRVGASTGGSDFAALIIKKFMPHMSLATLILILDCIIIAFAGFVFKSYIVTFYSLITMFVSSKAIDAVVTIGDAAKSVFIISQKHTEIAETVMVEFERGVTGIYSKGLYSGNDSVVLLCVVSPKELPRLMQRVRKIDPTAFSVITDAREVLGEGFKQYDKQYKEKN